MSEVPTIEIVSPGNPEEIAVINASDFQEGVHTRWAERKPADGGSKPAEDGVPDGCSIEHRGGGRYHALVGDKHLKKGEGDEPAVFQGKAEAIAALQAVMAQIAAAAAEAGTAGTDASPADS